MSDRVVGGGVVRGGGESGRPIVGIGFDKPFCMPSVSGFLLIGILLIVILLCAW